MLCYEWQLGCAKYFPNGKLLHIFRDLFLFIFRYVGGLISTLLHQKPFLLLWQNLKSQKISICRFANFLKFDMKNLLTFGRYPNSKINPYQTGKKTYLEVFFKFCHIRWNPLRASHHLSNLSGKKIKKKKGTIPQIVHV